MKDWLRAHASHEQHHAGTLPRASLFSELQLEFVGVYDKEALYPSKKKSCCLRGQQ